MLKKVNLMILGLMLLGTSAHARDTRGDYSIEETLNRESFQQKLGSDVKFYFGDQKHPAVIKRMGNVSTNKKTNAFNKSDEEACQWAFLSAMIALKERAVRDGGNAVIDIRSNYKSEVTSSTKTFRCGAGAVTAGVALIGTVVKIKN